jgi:hypothetical protein
MTVKTSNDIQKTDEALGFVACNPYMKSGMSSCVSSLQAKSKKQQHGSVFIKQRCSSLQTKMRLHKSRVMHVRLQVKFWVQCGAMSKFKSPTDSSSPPLPKESGGAECV